MARIPRLLRQRLIQPASLPLAVAIPISSDYERGEAQKALDRLAVAG